MPRTKINSGERREIVSLLTPKRTQAAFVKHLDWIAKYLRVPLWKVKTVARQEGYKTE